MAHVADDSRDFVDAWYTVRQYRDIYESALEDLGAGSDSKRISSESLPAPTR
jgi:hypothetical protein